MPDSVLATRSPPPRSAAQIASELSAGGVETALAGNRLQRLDAGDGAWLVVSSVVEIFGQEVKDHELRGPRFHLATVHPGALVPSLSCALGGRGVPGPDRGPSPDITLVMVGHADTRVVRIEAEALLELSRRRDSVGGLATLVEEWIRTLAPPLVRSPPPVVFEPLEAGCEVRLQEAGLTARTANGVVWVRHLEGATRILGRPELEVSSPDTVLPVAEEIWLTSTAPARLSCIETAALVRGGGLWSGLAEHHRLVLAQLGLSIAEDHENERRRLAEQARLDRRIVGEAHARLASVMAREDPAAPPVHERADPLLHACHRVGSALGLEIVRPTGIAERSQRHRLGRIAAASRIRHRWVVLRDDWWRHDNGPLLSFVAEGSGGRGTGRPVALLPQSPRRYLLVDPEGGESTPVDAAVAETLEGEAVMLYPPLPARPLGVRDLMRAAFRGRHRDLATLLLVGVAGGLVALLVPILTGHLFGRVIPAADRSQLVEVTLALVLGALATASFQVTRSIAVLRMSGKIDGALQAAVWDRLMSLPVPFFRSYTVGDLADRAMGIDGIRELLTGHVVTSVLATVFSLFSYSLLFYYSWPLALAATALLAVLGTSTIGFAVLQLRHQREHSRQRGRVASLLFGLIHGISKIRVAGAERRAYALWARGFSRQRRSAIAARRVANAQAAWSSSYPMLATATLFAMVLLSRWVDLEASEFLAFFAAFGQFQAAAFSMISLVPSLLAAVPTYERLRPILRATPEDDPTKKPLTDLAGDIELSHVSFRFRADGPQILDDVSFRVRPGEFVALVGPSGAGKSTCLRLILGFEQPESGSIYIDGHDLPSLDLTMLRRRIGVVLQDSRPMPGDLFTNIVGNRDLTVDDAWEAVRLAGLEEEIRALPMGLHTVIGEDAGTFSGGQLQRLLVARAIVHRPRLLLFDEATSALDNPTQQHITESLERLKATRVVVAHRLSTIRNADRIYVMDRGRIVEFGTYDNLASAHGLLSRLAMRQIV